MLKLRAKECSKTFPSLGIKLKEIESKEGSKVRLALMQFPAAGIHSPVLLIVRITVAQSTSMVTCGNCKDKATCDSASSGSWVNWILLRLQLSTPQDYFEPPLQGQLTTVESK